MCLTSGNVDKVARYLSTTKSGLKLVWSSKTNVSCSLLPPLCPGRRGIAENTIHVKSGTLNTSDFELAQKVRVVILEMSLTAVTFSAIAISGTIRSLQLKDCSLNSPGLRPRISLFQDYVSQSVIKIVADCFADMNIDSSRSSPAASPAVGEGEREG